MLTTSSGCIGMLVFCACVIALAAGVTWLVVRALPPQAKKPKPQPSRAG